MVLYRLTVRGQLGSQTLVQLDGLTIETIGGESSYLVEIVDQADLYGLLDVLQRAGVELVSVAEVQP